MKGFLYGFVTAATFGLIPLFTLPLMEKAMTFPSILFYRFAIAALMLGILQFVTRQPFGVSRRELYVLFGLSFYYDGSAVFLFWSYEYLASGIATALNFLYPVFVAVLMIWLFKEKKSFWTGCAVLLALAGTAVLSLRGGTGGKFSPFGLVTVTLSALSYALYMIGVKQAGLERLGTVKLTFYVFSFSAAELLLYAWAGGNFQRVPDLQSDVYLTLLALVPTVISNLTLVQAIRLIGSTRTAVLGAAEPLTAVTVGVLVLGEPFTRAVALGVGLIVLAVLTVVLAPYLTPFFRRFKYYYLTEVLGKHKGLKAPRGKV